METLTKQARALLEGPNIANLATTGRDGIPHITPVWIDVESAEIVFNTAEGRVKVKNLRENPHCSISIVDPHDPYNVLVIQGEVVEMTTQGADEHIDKLAKKYLGKDKYPFRQEGEVRLKVRIRPKTVPMAPAKAA